MLPNHVPPIMIPPSPFGINSPAGYPIHVPPGYLQSPQLSMSTSQTNYLPSGYINSSPGNSMPIIMPPTFLPSVPYPPINPQVKENKLQSTWTKHKAPDGRIYYYNSLTKESRWDKPVDLMTHSEATLAKCPWKEFKSETGKIYYHNNETKESTWTIPKVLEELKAAIQNETNPTKNSNNNMVNVDQIAMPSSEVRKDDNSKDIPTFDMDIIDLDEAKDIFKQLLRDKNVPTNASWEQALKIIHGDPRNQVLKMLNERKQVFNAFKTQRIKEEREEKRLKIKKGKEDLQTFLENHEKMNSNIKYKKAEQLFEDLEIWKSVEERDRKDLYEDAIYNIAKKEKEETRMLRKRNIKNLKNILENMNDLSFLTTWSQCQQMLMNHDGFKKDLELQQMDKEDALLCFQDYIRQLEKDNEEEKELEKKHKKRVNRKRREAMIVLLDELHEKGKLNSMAQWVDLYSVVSADTRYDEMLFQPGSTPLDLFKFYVEDLKARFYEEKKVIKEIMKDHKFSVDLDTIYEQFCSTLLQDERHITLDIGNIKLAFDHMQEKAKIKKREKAKDESRVTKKLESAYLIALDRALQTDLVSNDSNLGNEDEGGDNANVKTRLKDLIKNIALISEQDARSEQIEKIWKTKARDIFVRYEKEAFESITLESERYRLFHCLVENMRDSCGHHHSTSKKHKKKHHRKSKKEPSPTMVILDSSGDENSSNRPGSELRDEVKVIDLESEDSNTAALHETASSEKIVKEPSPDVIRSHPNIDPILLDADAENSTEHQQTAIFIKKKKNRRYRGESNLDEGEIKGSSSSPTDRPDYDEVDKKRNSVSSPQQILKNNFSQSPDKDESNIDMKE